MYILAILFATWQKQRELRANATTAYIRVLVEVKSKNGLHEPKKKQLLTGGKFKNFLKKNEAKNFWRALEAVESIREVRSLPKVADCSQDYSDISGFSECESLDVSPQFPWKIQLPA